MGTGWKESPLALRLLVSMLRRRLADARRDGNPDILSAARALYAVERRVRERLAAGDEVGDAYDALRDALEYLRDGAQGPAVRDFNARLNAVEHAARETVLRSYPPRGYLELTTRCNLRCPICTHSHIPPGDRPAMTLDDVQRLEPALRHMQELRVFGFGESLLVDFLDRVLDMLPPDCNSVLHTNGLPLTPERGRMLIERGLKTLCFSVDAVDRETYAAIRGGDHFDRVMANAREFLRARREARSDTPFVSFVFVAMRRNIEQLPAFVRTVAEMGAQAVSVAYLTVYSEEWRNDSLFYHQDLAERCFDEAERVGREVGIEVSLPKRFSGADGQDPGRTPCAEPWTFVYFRADGGIAPCCAYNTPYGSWRENDFWDVWNNEAYRHLRRTINTVSEPAFCAECKHIRFRDVRSEANHIFIQPDNLGAPGPNANA